MAARHRRIKKAEGGGVKPLSPAPAPGSIEKLGVTDYRREAGRGPDGRFQVYPYPKTYKAGGRIPGKKAKRRMDRRARG